MEAIVNHLYWYTSSHKNYLTFSKQTNVSKGFTLVIEKVSLPHFKQLIFRKDTQHIQVILYAS